MSTNYLIKQSRWQSVSKIIMCNKIMLLKASAVMEWREYDMKEKLCSPRDKTIDLVSQYEK